ncbi:MAG: ATP-dependent Clp protease ATP-binding subunit [Prevotellaceae bacterium]|nr:ATP-dependent Clp protease ATP-binding subunit [Prevotellaceae bacterium]
MTTQFTQQVSEILAFGKEEALRLNTPFVGPEHLMLGILRQNGQDVADVFRKLNIDPKVIKRELEEELVNEIDPRVGSDSKMDLTLAANNILKLAVLEARMQHTNMADVKHVLLGILHDKACNNARKVLEKNNIDYDMVVDLMRETNKAKDSSGLSDDDFDDADDMDFATAGKPHGGKSRTSMASQNDSKTPFLDNFGIDLTAAAEEGKLDPVVGREKEIQRVTEILSRRKKNNPVLIGEPGVGKSSIVEGLAQMIADRRTSPLLYNKRVINLDLSGIVAGTKYRGQFEERIKALIKEIVNNPDVIIFIDEIHTLVGAGSTPGSMDAANMLKPSLAKGKIQCIGATTLDEYRKSIEKDGALERRFQKIIVEPTTKEQTMEILGNIRSRYEYHHGVNYSDEALKACVELTERYVNDRNFPDKAIDALDETGAYIHVSKYAMPPEIVKVQKLISTLKEKKQAAVKEQNYEKAASYRDQQLTEEARLAELQESMKAGNVIERQEVEETDVADVIARITGIPVQRMCQSENERLRNMSSHLKGEVVAQDQAIDKMVKAIQRNRVGLRDPNHPIGVFMFLGPTGVGKTYLAKKLAEYMFGTKDALIRVDMSEYGESFNVSRLVGAPPGYVGYEEGGQLTERVRRRPYSIVLLDEIEKAHGNVFNMLLQVLDEGRLTDGSGRLIDFRNTVIIMTSNAGTRQLKEFQHGVGFNAAGMVNGVASSDKDKEYARNIIQKALSKQFAPEFLNRLDEIITFDQLDMKAIREIVEIEIKPLLKRVEGMGYDISMTESAKDFVAQKGYDIQFGARPLKRAIQNHVEDGLCELIINDRLSPGDKIVVDRSEDEKELIFSIEK